MHIYGKSKIDNQKRIVLTDFFSVGEIPRRVGLSIDIKSGMIFVKNYDNSSDKTLIRPVKVDDKNRIHIPKWLMDELGETKELFFVYYKGKSYLSPKNWNYTMKER